jgi:uncharacterized membrane protein YeaQ/YmgE (transglycosylase-associated protein family)
MAGQHILIAILVGLFAGWLVELIGRGKGFAFGGSLTMGALGAIFACLLIPLTGVNAGRETLSVVINAALGACILLFIMKLIRPDDDRDKSEIGRNR